MKLSQLHNKSLLVLGLGLEGCSALRFLRSQLPQARLAAADKNSLEQLSAPARELLAEDPRIERRLGPDYLAALDDYDVIVKSPGIPVILPQYQEALRAGRPVTSPTAIFFANFPGMLVGITGTKGKSTTSSLIAAILRQQFPEALLLGNIGRPALDLLPALLDKPDSLVVFELSSHQLEGLRQSPHVAVLLNVVPEHLDYYASFEEYVAAKENIARYQSEVDWLVFDADHEIPTRASRAGSRRWSFGWTRYPCWAHSTASTWPPPWRWVACWECRRLPSPRRCGSFSRCPTGWSVSVSSAESPFTTTPSRRFRKPPLARRTPWPVESKRCCSVATTGIWTTPCLPTGCCAAMCGRSSCFHPRAAVSGRPCATATRLPLPA